MLASKQHLTDKLLGTLYLGSSLSLALFCLFQSHRIGHDQRARDLAGHSIHVGKSEISNPAKQGLLPLVKKIGEESD